MALMGDFKLDDYVDVPARIVEFRKKYPEGVLQAEIVPLPDAFAHDFIAVRGFAYRTPDDPRPGTGLAWEAVPGKTPYTRLSELQNAETSAWGRAIIAVGAADAKKGIASKEDVRNRQEDAQQPYTLNRRQTPSVTPQSTQPPEDEGQATLTPVGDAAMKIRRISIIQAVKREHPNDTRVVTNELTKMNVAELAAAWPEIAERIA
jgi:hypothetical protein